MSVCQHRIMLAQIFRDIPRAWGLLSAQSPAWRVDHRRVAAWKRQADIYKQEQMQRERNKLGFVHTGGTTERGR